MTIQFNCPHCDAVIGFEDKYSGKRAQCTTCGQHFIIPSKNLEKAKNLDDQLLQYIEIEGARISKNTFSDLPVLGAEGYPKDWENLREIILSRDNYQCQENDAMCTGPLQIHHIIPLSKGGTNRPNNLTTLCMYHHCQKHEHMRMKYENLRL